MPPTSDPQARLKTPPRRVLFHDRHFVANRRRALPDPQGLRRRPLLSPSFLTLTVIQDLYLALRLGSDGYASLSWTPLTCACHRRFASRPSDLKRVKTDRTVFSMTRSSTSRLSSVSSAVPSFGFLRSQVVDNSTTNSPFPSCGKGLSACRLLAFRLLRRALDIKTRFRLRDLPSTSRRTADAPLISLRFATARCGFDSYATRLRWFSSSKTQHACLKRLVCLKIPWDRCAAGGQRAGARPHRGPRVNLTRIAGGGQLAFERGSECEVCLISLLMFHRG
ncbi:hypothetical protein K523DRAFT_388997 [Schizophyllum commune Tattone D]|nr:hypothetical protein K523DRAFT_388997 [Schizophyllum commune Tattone D]